MFRSMSLKPLQDYDIVIVGSGISCTSFLLQFLKKLENEAFPKKPVSIAVIEKDKELWKGVPYGNRSSANSLTITTLGEFVPPSEKEGFLNWLEETLDDWLAYLTEHGGETGKQWVEHNISSLKKKEWDDMYIPRYLFGNYINQWIIAAIEKAYRNNTAVISTIEAEAKDLTRLDDFYRVTIEDSLGKTSSISAAKVVLAIGSPPVKSFLQSDADKTRTYEYINDTYSPYLEFNLKSISSVLSAVKDQHDRNILILGSNASSLELLYLVATNLGLKSLLNKIVVISYSGKLPHRITPNSNVQYRFEHVLNLKPVTGFTPQELMSAVEKDVRIADQNGVNIGDVYSQLNDLLVSLLNELDEGQQKYFYDNYGQKFSKLIRRAGAEYKDAANELEKAGKLELVQGSFDKLESGDTSKGARVTYTPHENGREITHPLEFPLVINCSGSEELNRPSSGLIRALVSKKLCVVNNTNRGVEVNENFETQKGLYVMGPLLGGIFNGKARLWHVENAKSIFNLSSLLAEAVLNSFILQAGI